MLDIIDFLNKKFLFREFSIVDIPNPFFQYLIVSRVSDKLKSLLFLVENGVSENDLALRLLYRNILTDFFEISSVYLGTDEDSINRRILRLLKEEIAHNRQFQELCKEYRVDLKINNPSDLQELERIFDEYPDLNSKDYSPTSKKNLVKLLLESSPNVEIFLRSYHEWTILSKYEHIGWSSFYTNFYNSSSVLDFESEVSRFVSYCLYMLDLILEDNDLKDSVLDFTKRNAQI
ncbi:hypothetical protein [Jiulongibacter sp. NS-SX5]|uniref:hypothetical protein n=1 Tax=Jiulongibacter sp. NS-SX5 TaxID=3463854 RepID=UPI00405A1C3D